jgi:hypothetical protein
MRGAYFQYCKEKGQPSGMVDAVEQVHAQRKEEAELRLARIMNHAEPSHKNGCCACAKPAGK